MADGAGAHALQAKWAFWFQKKTKRPAGSSWYEGTTRVGKEAFGTVEQFWATYSHMVRPNQIEGSVDVMLFRDGIEPRWEDDANRRGGKWTLKLRKGLASYLWEELVLAIVGEQFEGANDICGAVMSVRFHDDTISLWNRSADDEAQVNRTRDTMVRVMGLPKHVTVDYTRHGSRHGGHGKAGAGGQEQGVAGASPAGGDLPRSGGRGFSGLARGSSGGVGHAAATGSGEKGERGGAFLRDGPAHSDDTRASEPAGARDGGAARSSGEPGGSGGEAHSAPNKASSAGATAPPASSHPAASAPPVAIESMDAHLPLRRGGLGAGGDAGTAGPASGAPRPGPTGTGAAPASSSPPGGASASGGNVWGRPHASTAPAAPAPGAPEGSAAPGPGASWASAAAPVTAAAVHHGHPREPQPQLHHQAKPAAAAQAHHGAGSPLKKAPALGASPKGSGGGGGSPAGGANTPSKAGAAGPRRASGSGGATGGAAVEDDGWVQVSPSKRP